MMCFSCGGMFKELNGDLQIKDHVLGSIVITNTTYQECNKCGARLLSSKTMKDIEKAEDVIEKNLYPDTRVNRLAEL